MLSRLSTAHLICTGAAIFLIVFLAASRSPWFAWDDAFITYRYAENLRNGVGFVYNQGEQVFGITTPLYGLLLAVLGIFQNDTVILGHWLGALGWIWTAIGAVFLLAHYEQWLAAAIAPLLIAVHPNLLVTLGMETLLLVALMTWVAVAWLAGRHKSTIVLAAMLILIRQDTAIWLLILGLERWWQIGRMPWRIGVAASALATPWFVFAWVTYGNPLPNSASAKIGQNTAMTVSGWSSFAVSYWHSVTEELPVWIVSIVTFLLAAGIATIFLKRREMLWLLIWLAAYIGAYVVLDVASFPWYSIPPLVITLIILSIGLESIMQAAKTDAAKLVVPSAILMTMLVGGMWFRQSTEKVTQRGTQIGYVHVGEWLAGNVDESAEVATIEIGLIGYLSNRPILDTMGLVSLDMTSHQVGWAETLSYAVNRHQPEYLVALPGSAWELITDKWWFEDHYRLRETIGEIKLYERYALLPAPQTEAAFEFIDGFSITGLSTNTTELVSGEQLEAWLHVDVHRSLETPYHLTVYLVNVNSSERFAITSGPAFDGTYGTDRWQAGDKLAVPMRLNIPDDLPLGTYQLGVLIYDPPTDSYLARSDAPDIAGPDSWIGWFGTNEAVTVDPPLDPTSTNLQWSDGVALHAVEVETTVDDVTVNFAWSTSEVLKRDLKLFLHVLDSDGEIVAQLDEYPLNGDYRTPIWQLNTAIYDKHIIALPSDMTTGTYDLRFGFYDDAGQLPTATGDAGFYMLEDVVQR